MESHQSSVYPSEVMASPLPPPPLLPPPPSTEQGASNNSSSNNSLLHPPPPPLPSVATSSSSISSTDAVVTPPSSRRRETVEVDTEVELYDALQLCDVLAAEAAVQPEDYVPHMQRARELARLEELRAAEQEDENTGNAAFVLAAEETGTAAAVRGKGTANAVYSTTSTTATTAMRSDAPHSAKVPNSASSGVGGVGGSGGRYRSSVDCAIEAANMSGRRILARAKTSCNSQNQKRNNSTSSNSSCISNSTSYDPPVLDLQQGDIFELAVPRGEEVGSAGGGGGNGGDGGDGGRVKRATTTVGEYCVGVHCGTAGMVPTHAIEPLPAAEAAEIVYTLVPYEESDADYLSYQAGELLAVVSRPSPEIWIGVLRGRTGIFSASNTIPHVDSPACVVSEALLAAAAATAAATATQHSHGAGTSPPLSHESIIGLTSPPRSFTSAEVKAVMLNSNSGGYDRGELLLAAAAAAAEGEEAEAEAKALPNTIPAEQNLATTSPPNRGRASTGGSVSSGYPDSVIMHDSADSGPPSFMTLSRPEPTAAATDISLTAPVQNVGDTFSAGRTNADTKSSNAVSPGRAVTAAEQSVAATATATAKSQLQQLHQQPVSSSAGKSAPAQEGAAATVPLSAAARRVFAWEVPYHELELLEDIGRGGFSLVTRAMWRGEVVAVKRLNTSDGPLEQIAAKLLAEAEVNSALMHRNIVQFRGACMEAPNFCLIMEFVDRGPLHRQLTTTLAPATVVDWATQLAHGMNYLHEGAPTPIIHRDLKSSNVLLDSRGTLKITDFGLARTHQHTTRMSAAGTFAWMSPEVIRSSMYSKGADVWAYGVVLWEMLCAEVPYEGVEGMAVAYGVATNNLTLPVPASCPAPFATLLPACWARDPRKRPAFSGILRTLTEPATVDFKDRPRDDFVEMQAGWHEEINATLAQLRDRQDKIISAEERLESRAAELNRRELELAERERALHLSEKQASRSPVPGTRKEGKKRRGRKSQKDDDGGNGDGVGSSGGNADGSGSHDVRGGSGGGGSGGGSGGGGGGTGSEHQKQQQQQQQQQASPREAGRSPAGMRRLSVGARILRRGWRHKKELEVSAPTNFKHVGHIGAANMEQLAMLDAFRSGSLPSGALGKDGLPLAADERLTAAFEMLRRANAPKTSSGQKTEQQKQRQQLKSPISKSPTIVVEEQQESRGNGLSPVHLLRSSPSPQPALSSSPQQLQPSPKTMARRQQRGTPPPPQASSHAQAQELARRAQHPLLRPRPKSDLVDGGGGGGGEEAYSPTAVAGAPPDKPARKYSRSRLTAPFRKGHRRAASDVPAHLGHRKARPVHDLAAMVRAAQADAVAKEAAAKSASVTAAALAAAAAAGASGNAQVNDIIMQQQLQQHQQHNAQLQLKLPPPAAAGMRARPFGVVPGALGGALQIQSPPTHNRRNSI